MVSRVTMRSTAGGSIFAQAGEADAPLTVRKMSPLLCPTTMRFEVIGETTMALIRTSTGEAGGGGCGTGCFIGAHVGVASFTLVLRHRLKPPASIVLESLA